jgi:hypothetical protein
MRCVLSDNLCRMKSLKIIFFLLSALFIIGFVNKESPPFASRCLNPVIRDARFEDVGVPAGWSLLQSTVHQRHMDRCCWSLVELSLMLQVDLRAWRDSQRLLAKSNQLELKREFGGRLWLQSRLYLVCGRKEKWSVRLSFEGDLLWKTAHEARFFYSHFSYFILALFIFIYFCFS